MAEQKNIRYAQLKSRPSQVSIQAPSGGTSVPSTPAQYGKISGKLSSASRQEQFANALGKLNPALRSIFFALGEGSLQDEKTRLAEEEKLKEQQKLLGESLADSGYIFQTQTDAEEGPLGSWKVVNQYTGDVQTIHDDSDLPSGVDNPLKLTQHNIDAVQHFWKHRKAYHSSEQFNIEAVGLAEGFLKQSKLNYEELKRENQLPNSKATGQPILFRTFYANQLGALRATQYAKFPREYHDSINIEKGLGTYRSAFAKNFAEEIHAGMVRDTATSVGIFLDSEIDNKGAQPGQWQDWRDRIVDPGNTLSTLEKDQMLINALHTRLAEANINNIEKLNPKFLTRGHPKTGVRLSQVPGLEEAVRTYHNAWHSKKNNLEDAVEKEEKEKEKLAKERKIKVLGSVGASLRTHLGMNPLDLQGNKNLIQAALPLVIQTAEPGKEYEFVDTLMDQAGESYDREVTRGQKALDAQKKIDDDRDKDKAEALTGKLGKEIDTKFGKVVAVNNLEAWDHQLNEISNITHKIFNNLSKNLISKDQASFLLKHVSQEQTRLLKLYTDVTNTEAQAKAKNAELTIKQNASNFLIELFENPDDLEGNLEKANANSDMLVEAGFNAIQIDTKLRLLKKFSDDKKVPKPVKTDLGVFTDLMERVDDREPQDDVEKQLLKREITDSIFREELSIGDGKYLFGLVNKDETEESWTKYPVYKEVYERVVDRYNPNKLSPFTKRGRAEIYEAYVNARSLYKRGMRTWAEGLGRTPTPQEVEEQAEILADKIFNNPKMMDLESRSISAGTSAETNYDEIWDDIELQSDVENAVQETNQTQNKKEEEVPPKVTLELLEDALNDFENGFTDKPKRIFKKYILALQKDTDFNGIDGKDPRLRRGAEFELQMAFTDRTKFFKGLDPQSAETVYKFLKAFIAKSRD